MTLPPAFLRSSIGLAFLMFLFGCKTVPSDAPP